ncbi:MAG TPA: carbon-nitrogen hydrolase family protein [Candidatus Polarisedimenticolaceae bacterium]|nr:carbon-nitrogen hydrolase family protein [Candidatus Polarisedimenticolaceae bacterium]
MRRRFTVAAVQMRSTADLPANLARAEALGEEAVQGGADLVAFPENMAFLREGTAMPEPEGLEGSLVQRLRRLARRWRRHVLAGSIPEKADGDPGKRIYNTSLLLSPRGDIAAVYRKLHLFDVRLRGRAVFEESRLVAPGKDVVVADTPLGKLGLTICYDLRFPELYRRLARAGAQVLFVPSAFTAYTGAAHWTVLLRARAIENQCWLVAPAQWGRHHPGRSSYGHTSVIDPWGRVVASRARGTGVVLAEIDLDLVARTRREMPCQEHTRPELLP